jgi:hypothetical protein
MAVKTSRHGAGPVPEGEMEQTAEVGGRVRDRQRRIDKRRHDDGAVHLADNSVRGLGKVLDPARVPDAVNTAVTDKD